MTKRFIITVVGLATSFVATGCSEAVPRASEGGYEVVFQNVATGGKQCNQQLHNGKIGAVNATKVDLLVRDGVGPNQVACIVSDGFSVDGLITTGTNSLQVSVPNITLANTEADPAPGSVTYRSDTIINAYTSPADVPCSFWILQTNPPTQEIATGRVWMSFRCAEVSNASTNTSCQLGQSVIALQNCDT